MAIQATQIRRGMMILFEGEPCKVMEFRHHTPGNLRAMVQAKLRNIKTGSSFEHRFRSSDSIERAIFEQHEMEFLYSDGSHHHFMNTENYDQVTLPADIIGDQAAYLQPEMEVTLSLHEGTPVAIELPPRAVLEVVETEPAMKGQTASSSYKPARLSNGVRTSVPPFITTGTKIVVMTADGSYVERAK